MKMLSKKIMNNIIIMTETNSLSATNWMFYLAEFTHTKTFTNEIDSDLHLNRTFNFN